MCSRRRSTSGTTCCATFCRASAGVATSATARSRRRLFLYSMALNLFEAVSSQQSAFSQNLFATFAPPLRPLWLREIYLNAKDAGGGAETAKGFWLKAER